MIKNILFSCLLLIVIGSTSLYAQNPVTLSATYDTTYVDLTVDPDDNYQDAYQKNNVKNTSDNEVTYTWFFEVEDRGGWEFAICDKIQCYFAEAEGKSFTFAGGEEGEFSVHLYPRTDNDVASAIVTGQIVNADDPETDTFRVYSVFNNLGFTSSVGDFSKVDIDINIFPNPATDYITVESSINLGSIEIHTITGKTVRSVHTTSSTAVIDVSDLDKGLYIVHSYDVFGNRVKASKLYKK